jgi:hypothetical protein
MNMKRFLIAALALTICTTQNIYAWGGHGHKIVAAIAEKHLTPRAQKNIDLYLDQSIVSYAEWMDVYRNGTPYEVSTWWHMITIGTDGKPCGTIRPNGDGDGIPQMVRIVNELKTWRQQPDSLVNLNLKWLIHMVADNHCPAHIFFSDLPGGPTNRYGWFRFKYKGKNTPYHGFWDAYSVTDSHPDLAKDIYAYRDYLDRYSKEEREKMAAGDPYSWGQESGNACRPMYEWVKPGDSIDESFWTKYAYLTEDQLTKAGYRLARLLNELFDN